MYSHVDVSACVFLMFMLHSNILDKSGTEQLWFREERTQNTTTLAILLAHLALLGNPNVLNTENLRSRPLSQPLSASCPQYLFQPRFSMWQHGWTNASTFSLPRTYFTYIQGSHLSDTKIHKITVIKTVWYLCHRQLDQQNKKEGPQMYLHR